MSTEQPPSDAFEDPASSQFEFVGEPEFMTAERQPSNPLELPASSQRELVVENASVEISVEPSSGHETSNIVRDKVGANTSADPSRASALLVDNGDDEDDNAGQELATKDGENFSTLEAMRQIATEMVTIPVNFLLGRAEKPRRYVYDRCDGTSDYHDHHRPPCPIFYVPIPVKWFPDLLEQNALMERVGKIGCVRPYDYALRKWIFGIATVCQLIAFAMTFYAAFAMSKDYDVLRMTSFTHGTGSLVGGRLFDGDDGVRIRVHIGLLAIGIHDPRDYSAGYHGRVLSWDEFCGPFSVGFEDFFEPEICKTCGSNSRSLVASMAMSLLFSIPSFTTDVLRFYPDYDVNCQKFFGSVVSFISMISSLMTWYNYNRNCVSAFYSNEISIYENRTVATRLEDSDIVFDFDWHAGWGYVFVVLATCLKIVDVVCNLAVPTPSICHDHAEQQMYEIVALNRDVSDGRSSYYNVENVRRLRESVMMAKEEVSRLRLDINEESELEPIDESTCENQVDRAASLSSTQSAAKPETTLNVPHSATPENRLHKSVYF